MQHRRAIHPFKAISADTVVEIPEGAILRDCRPTSRLGPGPQMWEFFYEGERLTLREYELRQNTERVEG